MTFNEIFKEKSISGESWTVVYLISIRILLSIKVAAAIRNENGITPEMAQRVERYLVNEVNRVWRLTTG